MNLSVFHDLSLSLSPSMKGFLFYKGAIYGKGDRTQMQGSGHTALNNWPELIYDEGSFFLPVTSFRNEFITMHT